METLKNLNKLWRNSTLLPSATTPHSAAAAERVCDEKEEETEQEEEEEESFFELELVMLNCRRSETRGPGGDDSLCLSSVEMEGNIGRRVVPVEPDLKPHSPLKFKVSLFKKPKTEQAAPDLKISTLIRENSSSPEDPSPPTDPSKRDVMHKYLKLKLTRPFNVRVAKRSASVAAKSRLFETPAPEGGSRAQLGKSRSASSVSRRDDSLLEHDEGIQSAILHCKRSFNSSTAASMLSGPSSDSIEQDAVPMPNIN
uniref:Membrane-associated kinase regulator 2 n=1 Tax=Kalanchoe fedtschenkoi TaxID=63787 RepID=A0A7N0US54_KALFE